MEKTRNYDVEKFVLLKNTDNTIDLYRTALVDYARFLFDKEIRGITDAAARTAKAIELLNEYVKDPDTDSVSDIRKYLNSRKGKPRSTTKTYTMVIRQFYGSNGHTWTDIEKRAIMPKNITAETKDEPITLDILKRMTDVSGLHGKLLITLLVSTGCRIGELCKVELKDLDLTKDPARIHLPDRITKGGKARTVFLTDEARDLIKFWLEGERDKYLIVSRYKGNRLPGGKVRPAPDDDKRLLGCSYDTARFMFMSRLKKALKDLKQDELTQRFLIHPHSVRKYFRTVAVQSIPIDTVEAILGHEGYLSSSYVRLTEDQMGAAFKKGSYVLLISEGQETRVMRERQDHQSERIEAQALVIEKMQRQIAQLTRASAIAEGLKD